MLWSLSARTGGLPSYVVHIRWVSCIRAEWDDNLWPRHIYGIHHLGLHHLKQCLNLFDHFRRSPRSNLVSGQQRKTLWRMLLTRSWRSAPVSGNILILERRRLSPPHGFCNEASFGPPWHVLTTPWATESSSCAWRNEGEISVPSELSVGCVLST